MKIGFVIVAIVGFAVATAIIGYTGFGAVFSSLAAVGWGGFAFLCAYAALPYAILGTAWFVLIRGVAISQWGTLVWARLLREAASELLPFTQVGGFLIGARAAAIQGIDGGVSLATTVVDVTTELIAQLGFTGLGISILVMHLGGSSRGADLIGASLIGLALTSVGAAGFIALQRHGMRFVEQLAQRFVPSAVAGTGELRLAFLDLYRRRARLALSVGLHLASWIASAAGVWLALRLSGVEIGLGAVMAIESLVLAVRSATFFAPMGVGVQEAAYALIGPVFGLSLEMSLALSLLKRARELAIGLPALLIWQGLEGRRLIVGARQ
jgi:putative membrane protein